MFTIKKKHNQTLDYKCLGISLGLFSVINTILLMDHTLFFYSILRATSYNNNLYVCMVLYILSMQLMIPIHTVYMYAHNHMFINVGNN